VCPVPPRPAPSVTARAARSAAAPAATFAEAAALAEINRHYWEVAYHLTFYERTSTEK